MKINSIIFYFSFILYKIIYEYIYSKYGSEIFHYSGLVSDINYINFFVTNIIFILMLLITPQNYKLPSTYLCQILLAFTFSPILSICWQANFPLEYAIFVSICYFIFAILLKYIKKFSSPPKIEKNIRIEIILTSISIVYLIIFTLLFGFSDFRVLDFYKIYEVRAERDYFGMWPYLIGWMSSSILPCAIVFCLYLKRYNLVLILIFLRLYMYLHTGSKTMLLSIGIILLFYNISKNSWFTSKLLLIMSSIFTLATVFYEFTGQVELFSVVPTRFIYIPALLSFRHYMFFSENPKLLFAETLIGKFINLFIPYESYLPEQSTYYIGHFYDEDNNANTGFLGDAFDNGGLLLMVIYVILLALILKFIDGMANSDTTKVFVGCLGYVMIILNDGSLLTTLFSHGLFLSIFFLYIFSSKKKNFARTLESS